MNTCRTIYPVVLLQHISKKHILHYFILKTRYAMSVTPMIRQYQSIRQGLPGDTILFFRMGDFYEMFFEDANRASSILDITLTARGGGSSSKIPMCGIPHHSAQGYINRLTRSGLKVAICEQVEDPQLAKGIVKREIVRIITPATNLEDETSDAGWFNYIVSIHKNKKVWGCAYLDLGTGDFKTGDFKSAKDLEDELIRLCPRECLVSVKTDRTALNNFFKEPDLVVTESEDWIFDRDESERRILNQFGVSSLSSFGIRELIAGVSCAGSLLYYLKDSLHKPLNHIKKPILLQNSKFMFLDRQTIGNLELIGISAGDRKTATLYNILDRTITPMGARLLSQWIKMPLVDPDIIRERHDAVEELFCSREQLQLLRGHLGTVKDIERILARINCSMPSARDIVSLGSSLKAVPLLKKTVTFALSHLITAQLDNLVELNTLTTAIDQTLADSAPHGVRDGGFIKNGYSRELDELRNISDNAKEWIVALQKKEMEETGIRSLKIKYNKVFGYYIDVTKSNLPMVPDRYIRKQTLVNSERFIIPELKEYEEKILGAEEKARELEYKIFEKLRSLVLKFINEIQRIADAIAVLDVVACFSTVAISNNYCKPEISKGPGIYIEGGRHPVVEHTLDRGKFVDNDVFLDNVDNQLLIITGPNMAGKSTYIRQVAVIVLMAQTGSFVPARSAKIGVVDRVFSRIGASDNLSKGESTFMVEMIETANILHNATSQSLLVFDEIGRGTSTFDGVSIAWSVCEYLNRDMFRPKCLFATHYHELTELMDHHRGVKNYNVTIKEIENRILFLRKVLPGGADKSYGIHVAKLAGLPSEIIGRAEEILLCLEEEKISDQSITDILKKKGTSTVYDLPLFKSLKKSRDKNSDHLNAVQKSIENHPVINTIRELDVNNLTPVDALIKIVQWKEDLNCDFLKNEQE